MKACLHYWILGASLLTACSSTPDELPTCDIPAPMAEVAHGVRAPEMPSPVSATDELATFDHDGIVTLTQLRVAAVTNEKVAQENADALSARNDEVNALIECASYQNIWMEVKQEDLAQEKREHFIDNLKHQVAIGIGVLAVIL